MQIYSLIRRLLMWAEGEKKNKPTTTLKCTGTFFSQFAISVFERLRYKCHLASGREGKQKVKLRSSVYQAITLLPKIDHLDLVWHFWDTYLSSLEPSPRNGTQTLFILHGSVVVLLTTQVYKKKGSLNLWKGMTEPSNYYRQTWKAHGLLLLQGGNASFSTCSNTTLYLMEWGDVLILQLGKNRGGGGGGGGGGGWRHTTNILCWTH